MADPLTLLIESGELRRFLAWRTTPAEEAELRQLAERAGVSAVELERLRGTVKQDERWHALAGKHRLNPELLVEVVDGGFARPRSSAGRGMPRWVGMAAAVLLALGTSIAGYLVVHRSDRPAAAGEATFRTITTARGERLSLRLPDSTLVVLAPASTIRIAATYGRDDRAVHLVGQAAFTVIHDERRPFVVHAGSIVTKDLGTYFVVRAYPDDPAADVAVAEGSVAVWRASDREHVVLSRGERTHVTPGSRLAAVRNVPLDSYFAWTDGRLVFRRTPLPEAVAQLERWYDIEVGIASPTLRTHFVSGSFADGEPAGQVLQVIATVFHAQAVQTGPRSYRLQADR